MKFFIDSKVLADHPDIAIGVIVATNIDNSIPEQDEVSPMLREAEEGVRKSMDIENFKEHPNLKALQEIHLSFGNNPNKFPPSAQALVKRVLKGGQLPKINPLVDVYNVISLKYVLCVGAEDLDQCKGDLNLTYSDGTEQFLPLGETEQDPPVKGELIYKDELGAICRKLNWREGDRTKITESSKNAIVVVEGFPPLSHEKLVEIMNELNQMIQKYCKGQTRIEILSKDQSSIEV